MGLVIPMVPVHVALHWLMAGPLAGSAWQPAAVPEALAGLIPGSRRGPQGELYLSRARNLCPDDCAEPEVCPVTGDHGTCLSTRNWPLCIWLDMR